MLLEQIFNTVKQQSVGRKNGREFWQPIKKLMVELDKKNVCGGTDWVKQDMKEYEQVMKLEEYDSDGNVLNHFLIQQHRIPQRYNMSMRRIIQLSLNIGLYNKNNRQLDTYISKKDIETISSRLDKQILEDIKNLC